MIKQLIGEYWQLGESEWKTIPISQEGGRKWNLKKTWICVRIMDLGCVDLPRAGDLIRLHPSSLLSTPQSLFKPPLHPSIPRVSCASPCHHSCIPPSWPVLLLCPSTRLKKKKKTLISRGHDDRLICHSAARGDSISPSLAWSARYIYTSGV